MSSHSVGSNPPFVDSNPCQVFLSDMPGDELYVGEGHSTFKMVTKQIAQSAHGAAVITRTSHKDGYTTENFYEYSQELGKVLQVLSSTQFQNGSCEKYQFRPVPTLNACKLYERTFRSPEGNPKIQRWTYENTPEKMLPSNETHLIDGQKLKGVWHCPHGSQVPKFIPAVDYSKKHILESGTWQLVPAFGEKNVYLESGERRVKHIRSEGEMVFNGKFEYVPQHSGRTRNTALIQGSMKSVEIEIEATGNFKYCPHTKKMRLENGTLVSKGVVKTGDWKFIPELGSHELVNGTHTAQGISVEGQWAYDRKTNSMQLCKPDSSR